MAPGAVGSGRNVQRSPGWCQKLEPGCNGGGGRNGGRGAAGPGA
jgi:hypothetical protein